MPDIIKTMTVFVADDETGEGVAAMFLNGTWMPLVAADEARVESLSGMAQQIADATGKSIKVLRFSVRTQIGTIEPRTGT